MDEKKLPKITVQAASFSKAAFDVIRHYAKSGSVMAEDELIDARMEICRSCGRYDSDSNRCLECGCFMPTKVRFGGTTCPLGFW